MITEVGGTVGDIEILPFLEAIRQFRLDVGRDNVCYVHVTLVPFIGPSGEQKTKPTQHSVTELRSRGIQPDAIVCRSESPISNDLKRKISNLCDVPVDAVVNAADARSLYEIPLVLHEEGLDDEVCKILGLDRTRHRPLRVGDPDRPHRDRHRAGAHRHHRQVRQPARRLPLGGRVAQARRLPPRRAASRSSWIQAEEVEGLLAEGRLRDLDGIVIPGGFGERGIEGKIAAAGYARENDVPCLGLCLGMHVMTVDFARNVLGMAGANSSEFDPQTPVPGHRPDGRPARHHRHGRHDAPRCLRRQARARLEGGRRPTATRSSPSATATATSSTRASAAEFDETDFVCSGSSPDGRLVEFIELDDHPFWVGTQAHPEFKSRPNRPAPLFRELIGAALARAEGRNPRLIQLEREPARRCVTPSRPRGGLRAASPSGRSTRAGIISLAVGTFVGARRRRPSSATSCTIPGAVAVVPLLDDGRWCWCASTGLPLDG